MKILESPPAFVTSGVADWLARLVDLDPDLAPPRTDPTTEEPGAADWLRRFVREVVTVNPVTRDALSSIQIFLVERAKTLLSSGKDEGVEVYQAESA
ncbi:MAG: hypothetical protein WA746_05855 [Isosphaeraceae bacterium]